MALTHTTDITKYLLYIGTMAVRQLFLVVFVHYTVFKNICDYDV